MKERGKSLESDLSCKKHPCHSSSVGVCPYCLKDKLMNLVCSDCGEQRLSSCSCSGVSSYRNSSCSVGRISFLIENEKCDEQKTLLWHMNTIKNSETETDDVVLLKRSSSCVVEVKKSNGFWKIGKLFKKKREKERRSETYRGGFDKISEVCVMDVSRSRSLSSFMDGNFGHEVGSMACSSAKVSNFNESEARKSGFRGGSMDFEIKESDFIITDDDSDDDDDSEFIDLEIDLSDKSKTEKSVFKNDLPLNERGIKKVKNNHIKAWKGVFKQHSGKKELNHILES